MDSEKFLDKIPDIYFDWYARLLPGGVAIAIYFYLGNKIPDSSSITSLFIYTAIAYLAGHIIQPLSSLCVNYIQKIISTSTKEDEATYANAKKNTELTDLTRKVSKAHAEAVGMLSTFFLVVLVAFHQCNWESCNYELGILITYLLLASIERSYARKRKITDLRGKV